MMRMRRLAAVAAAALALSGLPVGGEVAAHASCARSDTPGGEWPLIGGDLGGSRHQAGEFLIDAPAAATLEPAWTFDANRSSYDPEEGTYASSSEVTGYPVIAGGCVYVGTSTGHRRPGWIFALNADTGEVVWRTKVSHGVYATLAVEGGRVFAFVSRIDAPYVVALDQATGDQLWQTTVDRQVGADAVSSPVAYDGMVWVGVSGTAAEGDEGERLGFQGNYALLDAETGGILAKTWVIPVEQWADGFAGGAVWSTVAIDEDTGYGYVGTGNPFNYDDEHEHTNAVLKIDLDRARPSFGDIVGSYKGDVEQYFPGLVETSEESCEEVEEVNLFAAGFECGNLDLDFGAMPNIFEGPDGRTLVGAGQKSGVYHVFDAETMDVVWTALVGVPSAVGGIVGSTAVDERGIYGPHTLGGYLWSTRRDDGMLRWIAPVGDGVHWGNPVTVANRIVYTVDLKGFLGAYDAGSGAVLLQRPLGLGAGTSPAEPTLSWGGVSVARGTVYASVGVGLSSVGAWPPWPEMPNGFVIAFRPADTGL